MKKKFFEISRDLCCIANNDGYFLEVNAAFERVLGYSKQELLERPYIEFVHPDDRGGTAVVAKTQVDGKEVFNFKNRYLTKNGQYKTLSWSSVVDPNDGLIYATARDETTFEYTQTKLEKLQSLLTDHFIIAFSDKNGVITEVNDRFCEISGYSKEELIGKNHRLINSGVHTQEFWAHFWKTLKEGKTWAGQIENRAKDGSHYHVYSIMSPQFDMNGSIDGYMALRFEMTKEVLFKKGLEKTLDMLNQTNSIAKVGGWELVVETGELNWTDETFNMLEVEQTSGSKPVLAEGLQLFVDEHKPIIDQAVHEAIESGKPYSLELKAQTAKGSVFWVYTNGTPCYENGKVVSLSGTIQNIHERKLAEEKIKEEQRKSQQASKLAALGELAAGIAHEINNPLMVISSHVDRLPRVFNDSEKRESSLHKIKRSSERILTIAKRLTSFARISDEDDKSQRNLIEIIHEAIALVDYKAKSNNVLIETILSKKRQEIFCNQVEIEQVLINLLNNAIDAVKNLEERWVKIELTGNNQNIILKVLDSGRGLSDIAKDKVFEPFFTTKEEGMGTGLGLSITKGILDKHQASIKLDSDSKNTCFVITFPQTS
jgi:PAS domain S-box-containing protein